VVRICFVCLGNICRSPTAEGVMRKLVHEAGLGHEIEIDSAGTGDYHVGEPPDRRARSAARERGVELGGRARQFLPGDFARFELVVAMDRENLSNLQRIAPDAAAAQKLHLLRAFDPSAPKGAAVPDPYYGGERGFDQVLEIVFAACRGLLAEVRKRHAL
jgi:protein-tyrosine phosphatase